MEGPSTENDLKCQQDEYTLNIVVEDDSLSTSSNDSSVDIGRTTEDEILNKEMEGHDDIPATPVSGMIDFNFLYEEFKVKLSGQDCLKNELHTLMTGYYDLMNKYNDLERKSVEGICDTRANYDFVITAKDKQIVDQDPVIEEYDEKLFSCKSRDRAKTKR